MVAIKEKRILQGLTQPELAKEINRDVPLLSKFENYVCLPTPNDAKKLMKVLKCTTILELYDKKDITFHGRNKNQKTNELNCYKLTAELPRDAKDWLIKENLEMLGYKSIKDWANKAYEKFVKRVQKKRREISENK